MPAKRLVKNIRLSQNFKSKRGSQGTSSLMLQNSSARKFFRFENPSSARDAEHDSSGHEVDMGIDNLSPYADKSPKERQAAWQAYFDSKIPDNEDLDSLRTSQIQTPQPEKKTRTKNSEPADRLGSWNTKVLDSSLRKLQQRSSSPASSAGHKAESVGPFRLDNAKYNIRRDMRLLESSLSHANLFSEEAKKEIEQMNKLVKISPLRMRQERKKQVTESLAKGADKEITDGTDNDIFRNAYATSIPDE